MVSSLGKITTKTALREIGCLSESDAWQKAAPLDGKLDRLADQSDGLPHLREIRGFLLLDAGGDILVYHNTRAARRELTGMIALHDDVVDEDEPGDGFYPDWEPDYESG